MDTFFIIKNDKFEMYSTLKNFDNASIQCASWHPSKSQFIVGGYAHISTQTLIHPTPRIKLEGSYSFNSILTLLLL